MHTPGQTVFRILVLALCMLAGPAGAWASNPAAYGSGAYSDCAWQTVCQPTVTTAPSALKVAVNLHSGQTITSPYTIEITPLNDSTIGDQLDHAVITANGQAVTVPVASNGSILWLWQAPAGAYTIDLLISTAHQADAVHESFDVTIAAAQPTSTSAPATSAPTASPSAANSSAAGQTRAAPGNFPAIASQLAGQIVERLSRTLHELPPPVVISIPYVLLALVGLALLLAYWRTRREAAYLVSLKRLAQRQASLTAEKDTFVQLTSHYLRTPLAILQAALDTGVMLHEIDQAAANRLKQPFANLHQELESLVAQVTQIAKTTPAPAIYSRWFWLKPSLLIPAIFVPLMILALDIVSLWGGRLGQQTVNIMVQWLMVALILFALYSLNRSRATKRHEQHESLALQAEQNRVETAKNQLIEQAAKILRSRTSQFNAVIASLTSQGASTRQLKAAAEQFNKLASTFELASCLQAAPSREPLSPINLKVLVDEALGPFAGQRQSQPIAPAASLNQLVPLRQPHWLAQVLASVIDNAVAFSQPGQPVEVKYAAGHGQPTLTVQDHGRGIQADYLAHIFTPFSRQNGALRFDHEGLGFSLFLDRLVLRYIGGDVTIASQPGAGTTVNLLLPIN